LTKRRQHPAFIGNGALTVIVEIDIHHNVATDTDPKPLLDRAVRSQCLSGFTLSAADHLWLNCSRYYNEVALFGKRTLRPIAYTAPLLNEVIDWDIVMSTARDLDLSASLYYPLRILEMLTQVPVPTDVLSSVNPRYLGAERDFGWQLGPLFGFIEEFPLS
jgi:hypothetical protein